MNQSEDQCIQICDFSESILFNLCGAISIDSVSHHLLKIKCVIFHKFVWKLNIRVLY